MTPNLTAFTGVDSQNLPDVMVSVQFILAIGERKRFSPVSENKGKTISSSACYNSAGCTHDKANEKADLTFQK
ncbi:hypothetical protein LOB45_10675, partial [Lactobacillus delbrueckii subsp. lactis]|nr:hypothetical protein [Lactobacillus delbrueckii subsp. lactis]